jgi:hypothetical protein
MLMQADTSSTRKLPVEWRDFALFAPLAAIVAASLRVFIVSGSEPSVLRFLIKSLDIPSLLLATIVPAIPYSLLWLIAASCFIRVNLFPNKTLLDVAANSGAWVLRLAITFFVALGIQSLALLVTLLIPFLTIFALKRLVRRGTKIDESRGRNTIGVNPERAFSVILAVSSACSVTMGLIMVLATSPMWLPAERIVVDGRTDAVVGYVIEVGDDRTAIADTRGNGVIFVDNEKIKERALCNEVNQLDKKTLGRPLSWYTSSVFGTPRLEAPDCRDKD